MNFGGTALHRASANGHLAIVNELLAHGASVNAADKYGDTSLHRASAYGYMDVLNVLFDAGAKKHKKNKGGWIARDFGRNGEVKVLLETYQPKLAAVPRNNPPITPFISYRWDSLHPQQIYSVHSANKLIFQACEDIK
ncbi:unnamed protein product [Aphanomyces euteiches]